MKIQTLNLIIIIIIIINKNSFLIIYFCNMIRILKNSNYKFFVQFLNFRQKMSGFRARGLAHDAQRLARLRTRKWRLRHAPGFRAGPVSARWLAVGFFAKVPAKQQLLKSRQPGETIKPWPILPASVRRPANG